MGAAPAVTELMGGQVDVLFGNPPAVMPLVNSSVLRTLEVFAAFIRAAQEKWGAAVSDAGIRVE